jgi:hypothetical protein
MNSRQFLDAAFFTTPPFFLKNFSLEVFGFPTGSQPDQTAWELAFYVWLFTENHGKFLSMGHRLT